MVRAGVRIMPTPARFIIITKTFVNSKRKVVENPSNFNGFDFIILHPNELAGIFQVIEPGLLEIQKKPDLSGML